MSYAQHEKSSSLFNWLTPIPERLSTTAVVARNRSDPTNCFVVTDGDALRVLHRSFMNHVNRIRVQLISDRKTLELLFVTDGIRSVLVGSLIGQFAKHSVGICVYETLAGLIVLS